MPFTVINNPNIAATIAVSAPRTVEAGDAISLLTRRQMHVCGENMTHEAGLINADGGGAFLAGKEAVKRIAAIRSDNPTLPLILEPLAMKEHWASASEPFQTSAKPGMFPLTLDAELDWQRLLGSDLAITPTGQMTVGNSAALKAALTAANNLDRSDTLFALPMAAGWLSEEQYLKQLIAVINRSRHPVLLAFTDRHNPIGSMKRAKAYRRIFSEAKVPVVAYRTDLAGFDALAHGALASAIGSYPSLRRLNPVGVHGYSGDPEDLSPHMLIADMLRFVRSTHMRRVWFANAAPFLCFCVVCDGREVSRLYGTDTERDTGHSHNVHGIDDLYSGYRDLDLAGRRALWSRHTAGALDTYPQLETHINQTVKVDNLLTVWAA